MEAAADGEGEGSSSFRCASDAARYAVASVVTILIVVVVVEAVVVLRPIPLYLSVPGGSVFVKRSARQDKEVQFHFSIQAVNPSNRVKMYYTGIMGRVLSKNASSKSGHHVTMFRFIFPDMSLPQHQVLIRDATVDLQREDVRPLNFFDSLYEATGGRGGIIATDLTLWLDGTLISQAQMPGGSNTTGRGASFYCRPLLVRASENLRVDMSLNLQDAFCVAAHRTQTEKSEGIAA